MEYLSNSVQRKISSVSHKCYNRALALCGEDKISDAIVALKESISLDKKNIDALNLLGLCYYRLGRITEAIIQWNRSKSMKITDNIAIDFLISADNDKDTEKMLESVTNYNEALAFARDNNTDMAIMCLKKALDKNKYFVPACDLLALCYMERGNNSDALSLLRRALKTDRSDSIALEYAEAAGEGRTMLFKPRRKESWDNTRPTARSVRSGADTGSGIICFGAGIAAAAIIAGALVVPSVIHHYKYKYDSLETKYNILLNDNNSAVLKNEETIQRLTDENEDLKSRLYTTGSQELQQRVKTLSDIRAYFDEGNAEMAADKLLSLNTSGFGAEVMKEYDSLRTTVLPAAAQKYYAAGTEAMGAKDAETAKKLFEKCIQCMGNGEELRYSAMYQLGKIAADKGEYEVAVNYFNTVADKHPVASIKNEAIQQIEKIKNN